MIGYDENRLTVLRSSEGNRRCCCALPPYCANSPRRLLLKAYMTTQKLVLSRKVLFAISITALVGGVVFLLPQSKANSTLPDVAVRDAKRISDLQQVQGELELYFYECGY